MRGGFAADLFRDGGERPLYCGKRPDAAQPEQAAAREWHSGDKAAAVLSGGSLLVIDKI